MRITELKSRAIEKDIQKRHKADAMAASPPSSVRGGVSNTQKIVEKLQRKERDEIARVLKQT